MKSSDKVNISPPLRPNYDLGLGLDHEVLVLVLGLVAFLDLRLK